MARAFVIRAFGTKTDSSGKKIDFERVHRELIDPALKAAGLGGGTTGELVEPGNIREDMFRLILEADVVVLASAAPGADILAHEVCAELGLTSIICLPMPPEDFARFSFENLDTWRTRFLDLQSAHKVLVLSDREGLPRWLHGSGVDPWLRGNQWVMEMAMTWGAERVTLVALWDGKKAGDAPGGTAHMVKLAEDAGTVHIKRIDATQLVR